MNQHPELWLLLCVAMAYAAVRIGFRNFRK